MDAYEKYMRRLDEMEAEHRAIKAAIAAEKRRKARRSRPEQISMVAGQPIMSKPLPPLYTNVKGYQTRYPRFS